MLGFLTSKVGLYLLAALFLALFVGSVVLEMRYLEKKVENLITYNAQLAVANQSLSKNMQALQQQQLQIVQEFTNARNADNAAANNVQRTANKLSSKANQFARVRSKKPLLLINLLNKNLECERVHFLNAGHCVNGLWKTA